MIAILCAAIAASPTATTLIEATVSDDLSRVAVTVTQTLTSSAGDVPIVLAAERYRHIPDDLLPSAEVELFNGSFDAGGFDDLEITIDGRRCEPRIETRPEGEAIAWCDGPARLVEIEASLDVPDRYGPFSRHASQLTLGGGWYPYVARPDAPAPAGAVDVKVSVPAERGAVIADKWFPPEPAGPRRTLAAHFDLMRIVPLVVTTKTTDVRPIAGGRALLISKRARLVDDLHLERLLSNLDEGLTEALDFAVLVDGTEAMLATAPVLIVEAPLRHDLARATNGHVLLSDHAFRLTPLDRFLRFHRFPIVREVFATMLMRANPSSDPLSIAGADAVAAWLVDRYAKEGYGEAEDVFDVLSLVSFIPAVDSMLYAPQFPFVGAFFRLIRETDPLRANLVDYPSTYPRGKLLYEKLIDRVGEKDTTIAMEAIAQGTDVTAALRVALCDDTDEFMTTWLGPYPAVQYRIADYGENDGRAFVTFERTGDAIAEPVEIAFVDDDGNRRIVKSEASRDELRTVTATLAAPLDEVILDPRGRLAEAPSVEVPSPKFDNRSDPRWRFLLNNFNLLFSPTAGTIDTALDVGYSRVRDVRWRFATRASYAPEAVSLSSRATYYFGAPLTPDRLSQWLGVVGAGEYLRPEFAGETRDALAASAALYYGWDTRRTVWAPEAGEAVRASIAYGRIFGELEDEDVTPNSVSVSVRGLKAWRFDAAHQVSVRGSLGTFLTGTPRRQLLYSLGGRRNVRGYRIDDTLGRFRGLVSGEWLHPILSDMDDNFLEMNWVTKLDGAIYADIAVIGDDPEDAFTQAPKADVGYGFRIYIDYFGVRPGVMAIDIAFPLVDGEGRFTLGPPAVYVDFAQSFLVF